MAYFEGRERNGILEQRGHKYMMGLAKACLVGCLCRVPYGME